MMVYLNWSVNDCVDQAALFEEEELDQYEVEDNKVEYSLLYQDGLDKNSLTGDDLYICVGNAANAFTNIYVDLKKYNYIGEFNQKIDIDADGKSKKSHKKQSCPLHKKESVVLCLLNYHMESKDCFTWISTLLQEVHVKRVHVLCSFPKSHFVGSEELRISDADFLRCLQSPVCDLKTSVPLLEGGNMVGNLPAAILSYCSAHTKSCMMYVAFTESHFVDVFTLKCFAPVLDELDLEKVTSSLLREKLKNFDGRGVADNNVYI